MTGNPSIANIHNFKKIKTSFISKKINFELFKDKYIVLIQHPLSSESSKTKLFFSITVNALLNFCKKNKGFKVVAIRPNSDPGSDEIVKILHKVSLKFSNKFTVCNNLNSELFVNLIRNCFCVAGNSSMGLLETPYYGKYALNIGNRQKGRVNPGNVIFVKNNFQSIIRGMETIVVKKKSKTKIDKKFYGDKNSAKNILNVIKTINLEDLRWINKKKLCL